MKDQEQYDIKWDPRTHQLKAWLAHRALSQIFSPFSDKQASFTLADLKKGLIAERSINGVGDNLDQILESVRDFLLKRGSLNIITPIDVWTSKYQIRASLPGRIEIEKYLEMLAQLAGDQTSYCQHLNNLERIQHKPTY